MAAVPIPWFRGGPMMLGKGLRAQRQLQALSGAMGALGGTIRRNRETREGDAALADEEASLERQLGESQARVHDDAKSEVERAHEAGGDPQAVRNDPAGVADTTHTENNSVLQNLGSFMEKGVQRLLFGDPERIKRQSHITRMKAELEQQKRREEFIKNVGPTAFRSDDPGAVFRAAGGARYGVTGPFPRAAGGRGGGGGGGGAQSAEGGPPKVGGGLTDRARWGLAEKNAREKKNGADPTPDEVEKEFFQLKEAEREAVDASKDKTWERHHRRVFDDQKQLNEQKPQGGYSESYWVDESGNRVSERDAVKMGLKGQTVTKRTVRHTGQPPEPKLDVPITDPGREFGVDFFGGGQ